MRPLSWDGMELSFVIVCVRWVTVTPETLLPNEAHQRMAGEEYPCQDANYRHSAAWDCSHLRFIAICDSAIRRVAIFAARSLPDETQLACQVTTVRATWQVDRAGAAEILWIIIVSSCFTFEAESLIAIILEAR